MPVPEVAAEIVDAEIVTLSETDAKKLDQRSVDGDSKHRRCGGATRSIQVAQARHRQRTTND